MQCCCVRCKCITVSICNHDAVLLTVTLCRNRHTYRVGLVAGLRRLLPGIGARILVLPLIAQIFAFGFYCECCSVADRTGIISRLGCNRNRIRLNMQRCFLRSNCISVTIRQYNAILLSIALCCDRYAQCTGIISCHSGIFPFSCRVYLPLTGKVLACRINRKAGRFANYAAVIFRLSDDTELRHIHRLL